MLGHLSLYSSAEEIKGAFDASAFGMNPPRDYVPQFNIAPGGRCVVEWRMSIGDGSQCDFMRWGLQSRRAGRTLAHCFVPGDVHDRLFPEVLGHCRCLVPVNGFFLFAPSAGECDSSVRAFYFRLRDDPIMCLAGMREDVDAIEPEDPEFFERYMTFAILDTFSNDAWMSIQPRMPVIVQRDQCFRWLWDDLTEEEVHEICQPLGMDQLEFYEVSDRVMDANENDAALMEAIITDET